MRRTPVSCTIAVAIVVGLSSVIYAQNFVTLTTAGAGPINLTQRPAATTFIATNADSTEIFKNVALGQAQSTVLNTVAGSLIHLPVIGFAGTAVAVAKVTKIFGHESAAKGFDITYLRDLSASVSVARGNASFSIPVQPGVDNSGLLLLRLRQSAKDSARIVRSIHVSIKQTKSQINPVTTEVLGTEQDVVASHAEVGNNYVTLTPTNPLEPGEYALVSPIQSSNDPAAALLAWDFRVQ